MPLLKLTPSSYNEGMIAIDVYFLLNAAFDLILLQAVALRMKKKRYRLRLIAAAAAGALWSCAALLNPQWPQWILLPVTWLLCPSVMCLLACRPSGIRELAISILWFYLFACGGSGLMNLIWGVSAEHKGTGLVITMALAQLLLSLCYIILFRDKDNKTLFYKTVLEYRGRQAEIIGLWDTGNRLRSLTGRPVHLIDQIGAAMLLEPKELEALAGLSLADNGLKEKEYGSGLKIQPVPYCGIGSGGGYLQAFAIDRITVIKEGQAVCKERPLIGISETLFSEGKRYRIILNPSEF